MVVAAFGIVNRPVLASICAILPVVREQVAYGDAKSGDNYDAHYDNIMAHQLSHIFCKTSNHKPSINPKVWFPKNEVGDVPEAKFHIEI